MASRIAEAPISIFEMYAPTIEQVREKILNWRQNNSIFENTDSPGLIIIDYFRMIRFLGEYSGEKSGSAISRTLKQLTNEMQLSTIVTAGLRPGIERHRIDKRPSLADFAEYEESLADDADTVYLLYRDEMYNSTKGNTGIAEVYVAKQRFGPLGSLELNFLSKYGRFENLDSIIKKQL
jgi:replicative DNA helicase